MSFYGTNITIHRAFRKRIGFRGQLLENHNRVTHSAEATNNNIIIQTITTAATINPSDFRNQTIRFPTNDCAHRSVCNTNNIIIFHNITQSPGDNTRLCLRNCIFRRKHQLHRILSVQRTSFPGNTPAEAAIGYLLYCPIDCPSSAAAAAQARLAAESRIILSFFFSTLKPQRLRLLAYIFKILLLNPDTIYNTFYNITI